MKIVLSSAILASVLAPAFSFSYLESLNKANPVALSGGGSKSNGASYLDAIASPVSTAPSGAGIGSYLDALGGSASAAPVAAAPAPAAPAAAAPAPAAPVASSSSDSSAAPVAAGGNYLAALSTGPAIRGPGITSYLDTVKTNAPAAGGAGIPTYKDAIASTNVVTGTGAGMNTYTDNLSGGSKPSKSYSPFGGSSKAAFSPSFSGSAGGQAIGFTLEASDLSDLVQSMSGGGTIRLSGSIDSVSFN
jgi:2-oxoglutarate dehydrogenase E2 component (dihydrolipoamide succinyltransferase)